MKSKLLYFLTFLSLVFLLCDIIAWSHFKYWPAVDLFSSLLSICLIIKFIIWCIYHEKKHYETNEQIENNYKENHNSSNNFKFPEDFHF